MQSDGSTRVLHVDDDPRFLDLTAMYLEQESSQLRVESKESVDEALAYLRDNTTDCIVSDYDMPRKNGIEFLRLVRQDDAYIPFILFTGKGSEAVASDAISAGVTGYLQKGGSETYELLANRIERAVSEARLQEHRRNIGQDPLELLEQLDDPLYALTEDCVFTYLNEAATELFEMNEQQLLESCLWELSPELRDTNFYDHYRRAATDESTDPYTVEAAVGPWESWYRAFLYPNDNGVTVISREITEKKQQENSLQRYQELLEHVEDITDVGGFEANIQTGEQIWTDGTYRIHDLEPDGEFDPTVDNAVEFYHPEDREVIERAIERCVSEREPYQEELRITTGSGRDRWIRTHGVPIEQDGEITHLRGAAEDITRQKRRENQLQERNEQLEEFVNVVSHDLRNPLQVADAQVELIRDECESDHIDSLARSLARMEALIEDLLTLAREDGQVGETELVKLAIAATNSWQTVNTEQATLDTEPLQTIEADRSRLRQLFENLFRNAVEHAGDDVTVSVGGTDGGFYVADTGPGIPKSDREEVFEPGYSTAKDGTGFGLRIVEQVVNAHGWEITVTESEQGGARFEVTGIEDSA